MHNNLLKRSMPKILIGAISILVFVGISTPIFASEPDNWRNDKVCGRKLSIPIKSDIKGCQEAYCVHLSTSSRICSCLKSTEFNKGTILIEKSGTVIREWDTPLLAPLMSLNEYGFRVDAADLKGDGKEELIVAALDAVSNGMAVEYWTVWAVNGTAVSKPVSIMDYGRMGFLTQNKAEPGCKLLVTRWMEGYEPKRKDGLYLVGQWFDIGNFEDGGSLMSADRPVIYRRYLYSFESQREEAKKPLLWFHNLATKRVIGPYPKVNQDCDSDE